MRLGKKQIAALASVGRPTSAWIVGGNRMMLGLRDKGLLAPIDAMRPDGCLAITPLGLRVLADELEAGRIKRDWFKDKPNG